jgi:hypothetical protein
LNWIPVTKKQPCPICAYTQWCMISKDGQSILCHRIQSNKPTPTGWIHKLTETINIPVPITQIKNIPKADINTLDKTYSTLLSLLSLYPRHKDNLIHRGLPEDQIKILNYKSMPESERYEIVKTLSQNLDLQGVPGFWFDSYGHWRLSGQPGICIPIRNLNGQISGIQIRCDDTTTGKYKWLSSPNKPKGSSSGLSIHISIPPNSNKKEIWITEGPIKADICAFKLNRIFIAVPGVCNWAGIIPYLTELKPKKIIIAYDSDKATKPDVKLNEHLLTNHLKQNHFRVEIANWDTKYKGLDDLLITGDIEWKQSE